MHRWEIAQQRFSTCFTAMLRDELGGFVAHITVLLVLHEHSFQNLTAIKSCN